MSDTRETIMSTNFKGVNNYSSNVDEIRGMLDSLKRSDEAVYADLIGHRFCRLLSSDKSFFSDEVLYGIIDDANKKRESQGYRQQVSNSQLSSSAREFLPSTSNHKNNYDNNQLDNVQSTSYIKKENTKTKKVSNKDRSESSLQKSTENEFSKEHYEAKRKEWKEDIDKLWHDELIKTFVSTLKPEHEKASIKVRKDKFTNLDFGSAGLTKTSSNADQGDTHRFDKSPKQAIIWWFKLFENKVNGDDKKDFCFLKDNNENIMYGKKIYPNLKPNVVTVDKDGTEVTYDISEDDVEVLSPKFYFDVKNFQDTDTFVEIEIANYNLREKANRSRKDPQGIRKEKSSNIDDHSDKVVKSKNGLSKVL